MASAIVGGLLRAGRPAGSLIVVEPVVEQRERLVASFGVRALPAPDASLAEAGLVVWAVKPQLFRQAAAPCAAHVGAALQLSVMAGIGSGAIARATGTEQVVRAMPNTPALIGLGIAGLFARPAVTEAQRELVEQVLTPTGTLLWVDRESDLDAVTALSGSGPAYVFYVIEALIESAQRMGLSAEQGRALALVTFAGATELARRADEPPAVLRERVTSKGGTTQAAIASLDADGVREAFLRALEAARARAQQLGAEFD